MLRAVKAIIAGTLIVSSVLPAGLATARREVRMEIKGPDCGSEVIYRWTYNNGEKTETYAVHAEKITANGEAAYQSISEYPDRVRRITMRAQDLHPLIMIERWKQADKLIKRVYKSDTVHAVRRNVPHAYDEVVEVPAGVHDPESFAFLLKGYPFEDQDTVAPITVLVAEPNPFFTRPRVFDVVIAPMGEDTVTVPAGTFECYVLEMSLAGILGFIVPDNTFWLLKEYPHLLVKAEGAGETVELAGGPFDCDGVNHCVASAEVWEQMK
jgi:hypothetical protein